MTWNLELKIKLILCFSGPIERWKLWKKFLIKENDGNPFSGLVIFQLWSEVRNQFTFCQKVIDQRRVHVELGVQVEKLKHILPRKNVDYISVTFLL